MFNLINFFCCDKFAIRNSGLSHLFKRISTNLMSPLSFKHKELANPTPIHILITTSFSASTMVQNIVVRYWNNWQGAWKSSQAFFYLTSDLHANVFSYIFMEDVTCYFPTGNHNNKLQSLETYDSKQRKVRFKILYSK